MIFGALLIIGGLLAVSLAEEPPVANLGFLAAATGMLTLFSRGLP